MGLFSSGFLQDSFRSLISGLGMPGRDKSVGLVPSCENITNNQRDLEALYRSNWLAKKIVDIPAFDATRAWRAWNAQPDEIEKLENTERAFGIQQKVQDALLKARLYGGSCIILGLSRSNFNEELNLDDVKEGDLKFVHVVQKWMISAGPRVRDITSQWFGEPSYYMRSNIPIIGPPANVEPLETAKLGYKTGEAIWIHPSRVVRLVGSEYPDLETAQDAWGDSVLQACYEALRDAGLVTQSLASTISDYKVDVLKIEGLTQSLSTQAGTDKLLTYLSQANVAKSTVNSLILDKTIDWERMQTKFEGLPEVLQAFLILCAGAADIPSTRLFGRSPEGMNATGDSDTRNYYDRLSSDQKVRLTPLLNRLDEVLIRHTFGKRDPDIHYTWNPLWQASATEKADIALKKSQAFQIDYNAGLIPPEALLTARVNQLIEDEVYPGLDAAMDDVDDEFSDDHMEYLRRVPPSPEEMLEMAAKKAALKGGPPGGGTPKALTNEADKTPKAGPGTKDSSSRRLHGKKFKDRGRYWRNIGYMDGEDDGHPFRGNQYAEGETGGGTGGSSSGKTSGHAQSTGSSTAGSTASGGSGHGAGGHASASETFRRESYHGVPSRGHVAATWHGSASVDFQELNADGAHAFHSAIASGKSANQHGAAVTLYDPDDYKNARLFLTPDHKAGFALKGDDIVSVFKDPSSKVHGLAQHALALAVAEGGKRLDCFDTALPRIYSRAGFRAVARVPFDDQYAPEGWKHSDFAEFNNGRPDVVFMVHDPSAPPYQPGDGKMVGTYDEGMAVQQAEVARLGATTSSHTPVPSARIAQKLFTAHYDAGITEGHVKASVPGGVYKSTAVEAKLAKSPATSAPVEKGGFVQANGTYTPEREALHEQILAKLFSPEAVKAATPSGQPTMTLLGGRGGSGKSWFTQSGTVDATHAIYINADDIQAQLPGYKGWNAALYHQEATAITKRADDIARALHVNVIHDATMRSETGSALRTADYKNAGYQVDGHYMFLPPQDAAKRAMQRFVNGGQEGRYVPPSYLLNSTTNERTFDDLKDRFDHWSIYQNMGDSPKLVATSEKKA